MAKEIKAYEVDLGSKYFIGIPAGAKNGEHYLKNACMIKKENMPKGNLEEALKKVYIDSEKVDRKFKSARIVKPYTFYI